MAPRKKETPVTSSPAKPRRGYSIEEKAKALTILDMNNGNLTKTSKETGIHFNTLRQWRESTEGELVKAHNEERGTLAQLFETEIHSILNAMPVARIDASYSQLAGGLTSLFDRWQRLNGLPTEVAELVPHLVAAAKSANVDLVQLLKGALAGLNEMAEERIKKGMSTVGGSVQDTRLLSEPETVEGSFDEVE